MYTMKKVSVIVPMYYEEEVAEECYKRLKRVLERINNNYDGLTDKTGPWNFLLKILEQR